MWNPLKKLLPTKSKSDKDERLVFDSQQPLDEQFVQNFKSGGGNFVYCEGEKEVLINLKQIAKEEQFTNLVCFDDKMKSLAERSGLTAKGIIGKDTTFLQCEYLSAYDGSIMVSGDQTKGRKLNEFSGEYIVIAHPKQIVINLSEALYQIRKEKGNQLPTYISSLKGREIKLQNATPKSKNIYLLLVEQAI